MTRLLLLLIPFLLSNNVFISGHLKSGDAPKPSSIKGQQIILRINKRVVAKTTTDAKGYYELYFLDMDSEKDALDFYTVLNKDTVLLRSVPALQSDTPVIDLVLPARN